MKNIISLFLSANLALLFAVPSRTSAETNITGYLVGDPPQAMSLVTAAINQKLKADLDISVEIKHIGWNDLNSKYSLVLAAGEGIDWIYTADWCQFSVQASRGAFKELSLEMIKKYMPRHYALLPKRAWSQASLNGKIFMIPTSTPDKKIPVVLIRGDLRKKYGIPPLKKFSDIEPYLAAVKKNEPNLIPMNLSGGYDLIQPTTALLNEFALPNTLVQISNNVTGSPFFANYEDPKRAVYSVLEPPFSDAFKRAVVIMKRWHDNNYINKNIFSNTERSSESFAKGKSAVAFGNSLNITDILPLATNAGYETEILPILSSTGTYPADPFTNNGVAIATSSKNVEKTLQFLDLIMEEPSYNYLACLGIEGKHYIIDKDGKIALPPGVTPEKNTYQRDAAGFWFANREIQKQLASWTPDYIALRSKVPSLLFNSYLTGFVFSTGPVKTEAAKLANAWTQYANPMYAGAVSNVDSAFEMMSKQLKAAKIDKVFKEIRQQIDAFSARQARDQ